MNFISDQSAARTSIIQHSYMMQIHSRIKKEDKKGGVEIIFSSVIFKFSEEFKAIMLCYTGQLKFQHVFRTEMVI